MAACNACGTTMLFGGVRQGDLRFCNNKCLSKGYLVQVSRTIPPAVIAQHASAVYHGSCPKCHGPGPVDVHTSYQVLSFIVMTQWKSNPQICCRRCGVKSQLGDALISALAGWWGFPWGLIITPVQIGRNIAAALSNRSVHAPSKELEQAVGMMIAQQAVSRPEAAGF